LEILFKNLKLKKSLNFLIEIKKFKVLCKTVLVHKYADLDRSSIYGQMVNKFSRNLQSISFLLFVISNIEYADLVMYDVEKKTKFSILIIPVY
jgi:hypothetical protein